MRQSSCEEHQLEKVTRDRIKNGKLFLYQAKTDEPVWMPLPEIVLTALEGIAEPGRPYYFWTGNGKLRHAPTEWQARFKRVFVIAGVYDSASHNQSHRLRDSFAVGLLEKGVSIETVSI
jgi:integrase